MNEEPAKRNRSALSTTLAEVPGTLAAAFGINCALVAGACARLTRLGMVDAGGNWHFAASLAATVLLLLFAIGYRNHYRFFHRHSLGIIACCATVFSLAIYCALDQFVFPSTILVHETAIALIYVCMGILLFGWAVYLFPYGAKHTSVVFSLGILCSAATYLLITFLQQDAAISVAALTPLASAGCFIYFRELSLFRRDLSQKRFPVEDGDNDFVYDYSIAATASCQGRRYTVILLAICIPMFCYALIFGQVHYQWVQVQNEASTSLLIELGSSVGTALAGALILAFIELAWSKRALNVIYLLLSPFIILALYLASTVGEQSAFLYLMLLDGTYRIMLFLLMLVPFTAIDLNKPMTPWWCAYVLYQAGIAGSALVLGTGSLQVFSGCVIASLVVLVTCMAIVELLGENAPSMNMEADWERSATVVRASESDVTAEGGSAETADAQAMAGMEDRRGTVTGAGGQAEAQPAPRANKLARACEAIAETYRLTPRETEVLGHLAHGHTAQSIADELVLSPSTAKTHIRNIYAKMDVHSQQELLHVVESTIDRQRNDR